MSVMRVIIRLPEQRSDTGQPREVVADVLSMTRGDDVLLALEPREDMAVGKGERLTIGLNARDVR